MNRLNEVITQRDATGDKQVGILSSKLNDITIDVISTITIMV